MCYYQITADLNDDLVSDEETTASPAIAKESHEALREETETKGGVGGEMHFTDGNNQEEDEGADDPNWLYLSSGTTAASNGNGSLSMTVASVLDDESIDVDMASRMRSEWRYDSNRDETAASIEPDLEQQQPRPAVKMRQKKRRGNTKNNEEGNNNRSSYAYRLSKIWDGVSTYMGGKNAVSASEVTEVASGACNNNGDGGSNFAAAQVGAEGDPELEAVEATRPRHDQNADDQVPITAIDRKSQQQQDVSDKITELFQAVQDIEADEEAIQKAGLAAVANNMNNNNGRIMRRKPEGNLSAIQRQKRKMHSVSGYFSDWAKWLTNSGNAKGGQLQYYSNHSPSSFDLDEDVISPASHRTAQQSDYANNHHNHYGYICASLDTST